MVLHLGGALYTGNGSSAIKAAYKRRFSIYLCPSEEYIESRGVTYASANVTGGLMER